MGYYTVPSGGHGIRDAEAAEVQYTVRYKLTEPDW